VSLAGAGTAYSSGEPDFNSVFSGVRVAQSVVCCVVVCLFVLFTPMYCLSFEKRPLIKTITFDDKGHRLSFMDLRLYT